MEKAIVQSSAKIEVAENKGPISDCGYEGLTNQNLVNGASAAGREAAQKALKTMGYIVTEQDGQVIKKYANGRIEIMTPIAK